ncbi:MAG: DNA repair protein RecN [Clostridium sp.]|nr:DNA repair protein RecN [Clostridium sp.]
MIESLHISNYALIDKVDIPFRPGFNIITGETGAGKSIMLGALSLLLGQRADSRAVRHPDRKSVIEAVFAVGKYPEVRSFCAANDIDWDPERCILRREISPGGRSRAFINDTPVPLARLEGLAMHLVDIHSQHRNQLLSQPAFQLEIIDTLAGNAQRLELYAKRYAAFRAAMKRLRDARNEIERTRADEEFTRYQLDQINAVNPVEGELEELERDREVIANAAGLKSTLTSLLDILSEGRRNVDSMLSEASGLCLDLAAIFDGAEQDLADRIESARVELRDIAASLAAADRTLSADPAQLEETDERIAELHAMLRRHHLGDIRELIALRDSLARRLARLDDSPELLAALEKDARRAHALAKETAREISESRRQTAAAFADELKRRAVPLGMKNLQCEISVAAADMGPTGIDKVEFLFAFNKNQPLTPVGQTASGGEISRLMLTIKAIVADKMSLPSIIFDEVDTGVSGDVANRMGEMMKQISRDIQVIAITHLPQVASRGDAHYKVYKQDDDEATHTHISELSAAARVDELALMLSGDPSDPDARQAAESLLRRQ